MIMIGLHNFSCSNLVGSCHGIGLKLRFGNSTHRCCFCSGRNRECSERERVDALLLFCWPNRLVVQVRMVSKCYILIIILTANC